MISHFGESDQNVDENAFYPKQQRIQESPEENENTDQEHPD
jgi:hypothetical protein